MGQHYIGIGNLAIPEAGDAALVVQRSQGAQDRLHGNLALAEQNIFIPSAVSQAHMHDVGPQGLDRSLGAFAGAEESLSGVPADSGAAPGESSDQLECLRTRAQAPAGLKEDVDILFSRPVKGLLICSAQLSRARLTGEGNDDILNPGMGGRVDQPDQIAAAGAVGIQRLRKNDGGHKERAVGEHRPGLGFAVLSEDAVRMDCPLTLRVGNLESPHPVVRGQTAERGKRRRVDIAA